MPQRFKKDLWSTKVRKEVDDIIEKIKKLPFITKMMDGTLSLEHFGKYIGQDIKYYRKKIQKFLKNFLIAALKLLKY